LTISPAFIISEAVTAFAILAFVDLQAADLTEASWLGDVILTLHGVHDCAIAAAIN
jgi:hypothetical protein